MSGLTRQIRERLPILQVATDNGLHTQRKGKRPFALCVWHSEKTPSMELFPDQGTGYCHGCKKRFDSIDLWAYFNNCSVSDAIKQLKEQFNLGDGPHTKQPSRIVSVYDYKGQDSTLIYQVLRKEPKAFIQRRPDGNNGWKYDLQGIEPLPYRLPEIMAAMSKGKVIVIVEGEKDADKLAALGFASTCNSGGAGKWTELHSKYFQSGVEVVIIPDNDESGRKHADSVASQLLGRGCHVKVVSLLGLPPKGDVSDWLEAGHSKEELLRLIESTPYQENEEKDKWPEPAPLQIEQLSPVEAISPNIISGPLKDWLMDISHRMQCPLDFVSVGAMVVASAIIGANCAIRPKKNDNWEVVPNLWGGIVARPSMLKSPSLAEVIKPLSLMEIEAKEEHESNLRLYEARQEGYKAKREALKADMVKAAKTKGNTSDLEMLLAALEPAQEPCRRRFKTNDTTVEKLGELLNENPRGILVFRDELTGLLSSWDREDRQSDRAFFLEGWNGTQSFTTDRIGRGTVDVGNVCISILGGIQPSKITAYLMQSAGSLTNDGMIQRFQLLVYPDEPKSWQLVDEKPNKTARDQAYSVFKTLAEMDFLALGAMQEGSERPFFRFSEKAQYIFYEWLTELETRIRNEEHPLICEHLAKYRGLMPSLALVIHLIDIAAGGTPGPVSPMSALMSAEWTSYLESHARRIYGLILNVRNKSAAALARKIQDGKVQDRFSIRDIYRNGWHLLDAPNMVEDACQELEEANWLRKDYEPIPNRQPKTVFHINPKIFPKTPNIRTDIGDIGCA